MSDLHRLLLGVQDLVACLAGKGTASPVEALGAGGTGTGSGSGLVPGGAGGGCLGASGGFVGC